MTFWQWFDLNPVQGWCLILGSQVSLAMVLRWWREGSTS